MKHHATTLILSVLLALALGLPTVNGSLTFTATLTPVGGPSVQGSGTAWIQSTEDGSEVSWQVNITDVVGLQQLQIVDGMGDGAVEGVTLKTLDPPVSGTQNLSGSFDGTALNPAVAENTIELAGHICMGHIYASAKMASGQILMGKLTYVPEEGSTLTCDEAVPGDHGGEAMPVSSSVASRGVLSLMIVAALFVLV